MGEDEAKEAFVAVYYSLHNCRRHHMGLCTCDGGDEDEEGKEQEQEDDDGSEDGEGGEEGSDDGDHDEDGDNESDEEDDSSAAFGQMPPQPKSIVFPGELAPALMKLYASSASVPGVSVEELAEDASDETAVRGMLLRLWSEGLLDVTS